MTVQLRADSSSLMLLFRSQPRFAERALCSSQLTARLFNRQDVQARVLFDRDREVPHSTLTANRYPNFVPRFPALKSVFHSTGARDGRSVERKQLVSAIEAGGIGWRIFDGRRADPCGAFTELQRHRTDPCATRSALAHDTPARASQLPIGDNLATEYGVEKIIGELTVGRDFGQTSRRSLIVYGRAKLPSTGNLRAAVVLPPSAHVVIEGHL